MSFSRSVLAFIGFAFQISVSGNNSDKQSPGGTPRTNIRNFKAISRLSFVTATFFRLQCLFRLGLRTQRLKFSWPLLKGQSKRMVWRPGPGSNLRSCLKGSCKSSAFCAAKYQCFHTGDSYFLSRKDSSSALSRRRVPDSDTIRKVFSHASPRTFPFGQSCSELITQSSAGLSLSVSALMVTFC